MKIAKTTIAVPKPDFNTWNKEIREQCVKNSGVTTEPKNKFGKVN